MPAWGGGGARGGEGGKGGGGEGEEAWLLDQEIGSHLSSSRIWLAGFELEHHLVNPCSKKEAVVFLVAGTTAASS